MSIFVNDKLGYYTVNGQRVESKIDACLLATQQGSFPQWHFNDQVWNSQDWTHEPETNILELYKIRARQIREQYDYVIVNYSGGSDSQTMVDAFLDAGCHIDEIVTIWNRNHTSKIDTSGFVTDAINIEAEYELTTRPGLDRIKLASPSTKITYVDIGNHTVDQFQKFDGEEWLQTTVEHLHPQYVTRWAATRDHQQLNQLDRGKRTAVVFGVDKPKLCIRDNKYCVYFVDVVANSFRGGWNRPEYTNLDYIFFYWDSDLPEIIIKQAHLIKNWFEANPMLKPILQWPNHDYNKRQAYEIITRSIIYPKWDLNSFQCSKTTSVVWSEWDHWFFQDYKDTVIYQNWMQGINYVEKNIDARFLNYGFDGKFNGFVGMINGHFYLQK